MVQGRKRSWVDLINSENKTTYDYEYHEINKICAFNYFEGMKSQQKLFVALEALMEMKYPR